MNEFGGGSSVVGPIQNDLKDAIISCARDEMRKLLSDTFFGEPTISLSKNENKALLKQRNDKSSKKLCRKRPVTATPRLRNLTTNYGPRRTKSLSNIPMPKRKIGLECKPTSGNKNCNSDRPELSYSSTKWIQKSASLINKKSEDICNLTPVATGVMRKESFENTIEKTGYDEENAHSSTRSQEDRLILKPSTRTQRNSTKRLATSTALERRAPTRPSTAFLVRAQAKQLSNQLFFPISNRDGAISRGSLPTSLDNNAWENELAKHIVNVYNNKIVSNLGDHTVCETPSSELSGSDLGDTQIGSLRNLNLNLANNVRSNQVENALNYATPQMVWIVGTGDVRHEWTELESTLSFNKQHVRNLYNDKKYTHYVNVLMTTICSSKLAPREGEIVWRQLVLNTCAITNQLITKRKYSDAIAMLQIANQLLESDYVKSESVQYELLTIVKDVHAHYYSKRGKPNAAQQFIISATNAEKQRLSLTSEDPCKLELARCYLHRACILKQLHRFNDSLRSLERVVMMMDSFILDENSNTNIDHAHPQILAILSVTYHNIAVIQIVLGHIGDACINSQTCRRMSRKCIHVTSRYLPQFEETHMKALYEMSKLLKTQSGESKLFESLITELFDYFSFYFVKYYPFQCLLEKMYLLHFMKGRVLILILEIMI